MTKPSGEAPLRSTPQYAPRIELKYSGALDKRARGGRSEPCGKDRWRARAVTNWYAAYSDETHQRWIDEGGHPFQV